VRQVVPADLDAVARIYAHYVEHSVATFDLEAPDRAFWSAKVADLSDAGWPFLVAVADGEVTGFAYAAPWRAKPAYRQTVEDTIYLAAGATGRGIGRRLLTELLGRATANGARQVIAVIADGGDATSMALHRALGFAEAGRLRAVGFKHGRWLDTVLMQATVA
jgi:phosphinothricin acetyltransferase